MIMKKNNISIAALIFSVFPIISLVLQVLHVLPEGMQMIFMIANFISIALAFILSISQLKSRETSNPIAITAAVISGLMLLLAVGCVVLALIITYMR